jgi:hypothetical protein
VLASELLLQILSPNMYATKWLMAKSQTLKAVLVETFP